MKCGQASASRQRPWCWRVATFPPLFFRLLASGWECWQMPLAPWRSWETNGPSTTVSKWSSNWAVAPPSPTARQKWSGRQREWSERHAGTLYMIISYMKPPHPHPLNKITWHSWIQTDLFSQSDWFSSQTVPHLTQAPILALRTFIFLWLRLINGMKGVCLCSVECRASSVHWEEPSRFTVKGCARLKITFDRSRVSCIHCVSTPHPPPTQHQHCTHSLINTDAQCTCRSVCVGATNGSGWPHLEIRGEPLHGPREADLINKAIVMALFAYFCSVHSLKYIYRQSELWLSSILL